nr:patatin-like phospholipase family protein [Methylosinus sp. Sm6]
MCLSGGGIRSASFCLGVLQALAQYKLLSGFDYISTVSGGGYIGAWLSAWRKHEKDRRRAAGQLAHEADRGVKTAATTTVVLQCLEQAEKKAAALNRPDLKRSLEVARDQVKQCEGLAEAKKSALAKLADIADSNEGLASRCGSEEEEREECIAPSMKKIEPKLAGDDGAAPPFRREPIEVEMLRSYTSYLTPRRGLMSLDLWTTFATYLGNLLLNWLHFLPAFLLLIGIVTAAAVFFGYVRALSVPEHWVWGGGRSNLLLLAGVAYALSELFTSTQLIGAQRRDNAPLQGSPSRFAGRAQAHGGFGASEILVAWLNVPLIFISAFLASALSVDVNAAEITWTAALGWFAAISALVWTLSFLLAFPLVWLLYKVVWLLYKRDRGWRDRGWDFDSSWLWLVLARFVGGLGAGVGLTLAFVLFRKCSLDAQYCLILGVAGAVLAHLAGSVLFTGVTGISWDHVDREVVREWMARAGGLLMVVLLVWSITAVLVLTPWSNLIKALKTDWLTEPLKTFTALPGLFKTLPGLLAGGAAAYFGFSTASGKGESVNAGPVDKIKWTRLALAGAILFFVTLAIALTSIFEWAASKMFATLTLTDWELTFVFLLVWIALASIVININVFSLHACYRNRLVRAYLGASNIDRWPNLFTGLDDRDNVKMHELDTHKPLHVVNLCLNLARSPSLARQERKASSFTVTPLAVGNPHLGYRPTKEYGAGITLGTAMAISGAAVSPSMGYNSSPPLAFLMTLFNARLGWWLGNPKDDTAWKKAGPQFALRYLATELLGWSSDETPFVHLSDGGHFDNLGVYEMLRRRCRTIVVVDAGKDEKFEFAELGGAIRKARVDFGVEIEFETTEADFGDEIRGLGLINWPKTRGRWPYCAVAKITYREQPEGGENSGVLIYVKPAIHGDESQDIWSYATAHSSFPHETTLNQFFVESQFESYRRLGRHIGEKIFSLHGNRQKRFKLADDLERRARAHVKRAREVPPGGAD